MSTWPATLPQSLLSGASVQDDESRLVSNMDAGPSSVRNRFTAISKTVKGSLIITGAQLDTFNTFYRTTLSHGATSFTWKDPETDESASVRFKTKPTKECIKPATDPDDRLWSIGLELEVLP